MADGVQDFYRSQDAKAGGTSNQWSDAADYEPAGPVDAAEDGDVTFDARKAYGGN